MSWWVYLTGEDIKTPRHEEGGTYCVGGTEGAELNITYNYSAHYHEVLNADDGLRWLHGKTAAETITALRNAVNKLGVIRSEDYWKSTPGNAGFALSILLTWAESNPNGVWEIH